MKGYLDNLIKFHTNLRVVVVVIFLLSLLMPSSIVRADDSNPPQQGETQTEPVPVGEVDEAFPGDQQTDETAGLTTVQAGLGEELPEQVVSQLPEGTDLVVVDQQGEIEPLVTQEAVASLVVSDPIWCPEGVTPQALANGCSDSYASLRNLLTSLQGANQPKQNGTIWVEKTYNSAAAEPAGTTNVTIDGNSYTT